VTISAPRQTVWRRTALGLGVRWQSYWPLRDALMHVSAGTVGLITNADGPVCSAADDFLACRRRIPLKSSVVIAESSFSVSWSFACRACLAAPDLWRKSQPVSRLEFWIRKQESPTPCSWAVSTGSTIARTDLGLFDSHTEREGVRRRC
jgi:hypothetical protein